MSADWSGLKKDRTEVLSPAYRQGTTWGLVWSPDFPQHWKGNSQDRMQAND